MTDDKKKPPLHEAGAKLDLLDPVKQLDIVAAGAPVTICHLSFVICHF
jgi:hypothetical protein